MALFNSCIHHLDVLMLCHVHSLLTGRVQSSSDVCFNLKQCQNQNVAVAGELNPLQVHQQCRLLLTSTLARKLMWGPGVVT